MSTATTTLKLYDMVAAARAGKFEPVTGRIDELGQVVRVISHPTRPHAALVAEPGSGKTSLTETLAAHLAAGRYRPLEPVMYRLTTAPIQQLLATGEPLRDCLDALSAAAGRLTTAVIVVEDIQLLAAGDPGRLELTLALLNALAARPGIRLIVTTTTRSYHQLFRDDYTFGRTFTAVELTEPPLPTVIAMVDTARVRLERHHHLAIAADAVEQAVTFGARFGRGRVNPDAAIRLLEDACVKAALAGHSHLTGADLEAVVGEREHLPLGGLHKSGADLAALEPALSRAVVGQAPALARISAQLARNALGLADPTRPRGSFLLLGPSGVGKTETAKALAAAHYHNPRALIRLDMSEYQQEHAAVRLIGSPPGYVGYEAGGQLTGPVMREPYSLVLLDEIEKAHPKLFDLFLQLLDDGRLTDSAGHTVDFTNTMVLATSNTGAQTIAEAASAGINVTGPEFLRDHLLPLLLRTYRPEFINRFDAILVYRPLGLEQLVALAQRELKNLATRLAPRSLSFAVPNERLAGLLRTEANPLFGARPVKRLIATHFEAPIATALIAGRLNGPLVITGDEPWLASYQSTGAAL